MRPFLSLFILAGLMLVSGVTPLLAQEFDCRVTINDRQISGSSYEYIPELGGAIERYINENRWTDQRFEEKERIKCQMQIILTSADSQFNYSAEVIINVRRPIYNTMQESSSIILNDNAWRFNYPRNKTLIFDEIQYDDLTSFIDFYMLVILGFDNDSFSEMGGSRYFTRALNILELGQNSSSPGWSRAIGAQRNRFGLINDLNNPTYDNFRRAYYQYHRHGLDRFTSNTDDAREKMLEVITMIQATKRTASNNYLFDIFFDTKYVEITGAFMDADIQTRNRAYNLLRDTDPGHSSEYERLQQ
jgi:hypothetical protein